MFSAPIILNTEVSFKRGSTVYMFSAPILQVHLLQTDRLTDAPLLVRAREPLVEYYVDHAHGHFYVFTNVGSDREYKVCITTC